MSDPFEATDDNQPADDDRSADDAADQPCEPTDGEHTSWSSEELAHLAQRMLRRGTLSEAVDAGFQHHPDLDEEAIEYVDDDELKP